MTPPRVRRQERNDPTPAEMDRINDVAGAIANLLGVDGEAVGTLSSKSVVLTVDQAEQLVALTSATALRALLRERHVFPDYPRPAEGEVSTEEDYVEQQAWTVAWTDLDARIEVELAKGPTNAD